MTIDETKNLNPTKDLNMTQGSDFFTPPKDLEDQLEHLSGEENGSSGEIDTSTPPQMTEPSDFFVIQKVGDQIQETASSVVGSTLETTENVVSSAFSTGLNVIKEVGAIRSEEELENISDTPQMTEPSDFFTPKGLLNDGKNVVKKTIATGEAGIRAGIGLGKEVVGGVWKLGTGIFGKLGGKKKDNTPSSAENNGETKSE